MRPKSLRARLALWHAGILALTLITLDGLTLFLLNRYLISRSDDALLDYADTTARTIATQLYQASLPGRTPPERFLNNSRQELGRLVQVIDRFGKPIDVSDALKSQSISPSMTARIEAQKGRVFWETRLDLGEHPFRVITVPVMMGKDTPYLVMAAASLEGVQEALQRTVMILSVLTPTVFVISLLGGWLLVGRSLKPVHEMTRTALAIEHTNLDRRIQPPSTDDEIARLASAFNEMIARLDKSFRQIQQFSADASHELKTPLTTMRGEAEVALMADLKPEQYKTALRSIVDEVERMSAIVDNLLLLARADAEQIQIRKERVALHELVMEVFEQLAPVARKREISLDVEEIEAADVEGDPLWLRQIVTNLINNAVKYTPPGGSVTIGLSSSSIHEARVVIRDTGPGIPEEHLPHIFDRFYRVDPGRSRDAGGVGLGLNIAQWAAEAHGGHIGVESEVGKGTKFTLCLPVVSKVDTRERK